jgi:hypothetical protein
MTFFFFFNETVGFSCCSFLWKRSKIVKLARSVMMLVVAVSRRARGRA